jgi:hypothetical protein
MIPHKLKTVFCSLVVFPSISGAATLEENLNRQTGQSIDEVIRPFEKLCLGDDGNIYARFQPNSFDYNTKPSHNTPITRAEHVRGLLILSPAEVVGLLGSLEASGTENAFLLLQKKELEKAQDALSQNSKRQNNLGLCSEPFKKPL